MNEIWHIIATVLGVIGVLLTVWGYRRQDKADRKKDQEANQVEMKKNHAANQEKLNELLTLNRFHPAHSHGEKTGALTVDGIWYADRPAHGD